MQILEQSGWSLLIHGVARRLNVPIYELLGGKVRSKIKVYTWVRGKNAEACAKHA